MASAIAVRGLHKRFPGPAREIVALAGIDLEIAPGQLVCLLGPSGCGKSTLLDAIAGFSQPSAGEVLVEGERVTGPGPRRGMVFQEYALFPWMTVAANVAFGLRLQGLPRPAVAARVTELLRLLGLSEFSDRFPRDLSGGMRQRVALARVLAIDPPILLMDEPFAALDALTRRNLQDELLRLQARLHKTIVFVTHSIEEAIYLADRVLLMTSRPGAIKRDQPIALPRPRDPSSVEFNALERDLGGLVMEEQDRQLEAERAAPAPSE